MDAFLADLDLHLCVPGRPEYVTLVREVIRGVAGAADMQPELLDDVQTAVSEAANNVIVHAYGNEPGPLQLELRFLPTWLEVCVGDEGRGMPLASRRAGGQLGMMIIDALASDVRVHAEPSGGTTVLMRFALPPTQAQPAHRRARRGRELTSGLPSPLARDRGDVLLAAPPGPLLKRSAGRAAATLAARSRFSLDYLADAQLATEALVSFAAAATAATHMSVRARPARHQLQLTLGPLRAGTGAELLALIADLALLEGLATPRLTVLEVGPWEALAMTIEDPSRGRVERSAAV